MKFLSLVFLFCAGCAGLQSLKKNPTAEELFQHAENLRKKSYYKEALTYFKQLKSRFLYSRYAKKADLAIADIYFAKEEWIKSAGAYENFFALHPDHPKNDHALFRLSLSYFHQMPETEDRDLSLSPKTLFYLNKHLKLFPKSPYRAETQKKREVLLTLLAKKEWMIARFHLKKARPHSARPYMLKLLNKYGFLLPKKELPSASLNDLPSIKTLKTLIQKTKTGTINI